MTVISVSYCRCIKQANLTYLIGGLRKQPLNDIFLAGRTDAIPR